MNTQPVGLILAGGISRRFWPLGWSKPLIPFAGKTVLEHTCMRLMKLGIKKAVIVTNHQDELVIKRMSFPGLTVQICIQNASGGMAGAVLAAKEFISKSSCLVLGPDIVDENLISTLKQKLEKQEQFIIGKKVDTYIDVGYLKLDGTIVKGISEKPGAGNEPSRYIYPVFNYFPDMDEFLSLLATANSNRDDIYETALTMYLTEHPTELFPYEGLWYPLKYPWHTLDFMKHYLTDMDIRSGKNPSIKSNVYIEGHVFFEEGVKIFENVKIIGPCYIGKNVIIGNNAMVRESQIGEGSVIGFNSDVARSYLGRNCWLHSNYVGDSILSDNVSMGSGSVLANFRLDEEVIWSVIDSMRVNTQRIKLGAMIGPNVRIGVQTSTMPGVKIGRDCFVGAGITLDKDLPDGSFCMIKPSMYDISKNRKINFVKSRESYKELLQ